MPVFINLWMPFSREPLATLTTYMYVHKYGTIKKQIQVFTYVYVYAIVSELLKG